MAVQNAEKNCFRSGQNGPYYQKVIDVPGIFAPVFANKVPALLARKSRGPPIPLRSAIVPASVMLAVTNSRLFMSVHTHDSSVHVDALRVGKRQLCRLILSTGNRYFWHKRVNTALRQKGHLVSKSHNRSQDRYQRSNFENGNSDIECTPRPNRNTNPPVVAPAAG